MKEAAELGNYLHGKHLFAFLTLLNTFTEIEAERALVNANRELIARFEKKILDMLAWLWGEGAAQL